MLQLSPGTVGEKRIVACLDSSTRQPARAALPHEGSGCPTVQRNGAIRGSTDARLRVGWQVEVAPQGVTPSALTVRTGQTLLPYLPRSTQPAPTPTAPRRSENQRLPRKDSIGHAFLRAAARLYAASNSRSCRNAAISSRSDSGLLGSSISTASSAVLTLGRGIHPIATRIKLPSPV